MPTYQRMLLGEIIGEGVRRYHMYCKELDTCPIAAAKGGMVQEEDSQFNDLNKMVKKPSRKTRTMAPWISDANRRLVDQRTALGRNITENHQMCRTSPWRFQAAFK